MSYQTTIPVGKISEDELKTLVDQIGRLTKADIRLHTQFVVSTEDANISSMLDSLIDAVPEERANGNGKIKKTVKAKTGKMTSHQVRIDATGEIVSTQAFNKRVKAGRVAELTNITNAKGQQFVVIDSKVIKGPQS